MRSTRAATAVSRLNERSEGHHYTMAKTASGLFFLREKVDGVDKQVSEPLPMDDFVKLVNGMGPQKVARMTKNDIAFQKQLEKNK